MCFAHNETDVNIRRANQNVTVSYFSHDLSLHWYEWPFIALRSYVNNRPCVLVLFASKLPTSPHSTRSCSSISVTLFVVRRLWQIQSIDCTLLCTLSCASFSVLPHFGSCRCVRCLSAPDQCSHSKFECGCIQLTDQLLAIELLRCMRSNGITLRTAQIIANWVATYLSSCAWY